MKAIVTRKMEQITEQEALTRYVLTLDEEGTAVASNQPL
jgi:hypothetical protein